MFIPTPPILWAIACLFVALGMGTFVRMAMLRGNHDERAALHLKSVGSWWTLAILLSVALMLGQAGVLALLAIVGVLCLKEYLQILGWKAVGSPTAWTAFAIVPLYYSLLYSGYAELMRCSAPVAILILIGAIRAWLGLVDDFIRVTAAMIWGLMLFVYCLSHVYYLLILPGLPESWAGSLGWILYLVLLTEINDISQALVGRAWGHTKIAPVTSPNKSLQGLLGGIAVTTLLAVLLAPWLTGFMQRPWATAVILSATSGVIIAVSGFLGDLNKSGIKRDAGIKDSGTMLPGQGGIIDRVDSLTFSAPVFFYFLQFVILENK